MRTWKKAKPIEDGGMPTTAFEDVISSQNSRYICWSVHDDWTHTVFYWPELDRIVSASNDSNSSFVIGCVFPLTDVSILRESESRKGANINFQSLNPINRPADQQCVFKVHKGVKALAISFRSSCLVSGGMDRTVRVWNPHTPRHPTAILRGHSAPIVGIGIDDSEGRIFSFGQDKAIRVWNLVDQTCIFSIKTKSHKIVGDLQIAFFCPTSKTIAMATDRMSIIPVYSRTAVNIEVVSSHREPVTCCIYNPVFNHLVSCSEGSVVKVWDLDTGGLVFEFGEAHGESGITSACFDVTYRRLVTGGRDGIANLWNYNNGECLKSLQTSKNRPKTSKHSVSSVSTVVAVTKTAEERLKGAQEVCAVTYVELNKNRYVISTGWNRKINIFMDNAFDKTQTEVQTPSFRWDDDIVSLTIQTISRYKFYKIFNSVFLGKRTQR